MPEQPALIPHVSYVGTCPRCSRDFTVLHDGGTAATMDNDPFTVAVTCPCGGTLSAIRVLPPRPADDSPGGSK